MRKVTIHSLGSCPHCRRVIQYVSEKNIPHEVIDYTTERGKLAELKQRTGHPTVPQVFFGEELIGGADSFFAVVEAGELEQRLSA
ncbi:glutaredoxin [bacterium]|nr:glutaredoxin [bacterium]